MLELIVALALVAANGFFVANEFSIARIRDTQVAEFEALGRRGSGSLRHAVDHIDSYLAACQLGITLSSIGLGFVGKPAFERLVAPVTEPLGDSIPGLTGYALSFFVAFSIVTILHVVFGELSPKSLAIARTSATSLALAPWMRAFYMSTKPLVDFFNALGNLVLRPFGIPSVRESGHTPHSEDELLALLRQSAQSGLIEPEERDIAERAFEFSEGRVQEAMVHRHEIVFLTADCTLAAARKEIVRSGHSRLPVCDPDGGIDKPLGIITAIDLLREVEEGIVGDHLRPVTFVPESASLVSLLETLRSARQHMSLVADEHGSIQGLITVEDLMERVFGEIYDEFDTGLSADDPDSIAIQPDGSCEVPGSFPIHALVRRGILLPAGSYTTIAGCVLDQVGKVPECGHTIDIERWTLEVTAVDGTTIERVVIRPR